MYVYAPGHACALRGQKSATGVRWLSHHTGAVNRTWVICKSSEYT